MSLKFLSNINAIFIDKIQIMLSTNHLLQRRLTAVVCQYPNRILKYKLDIFIHACLKRVLTKKLGLPTYFIRNFFNRMLFSCSIQLLENITETPGPIFDHNILKIF